VNCRLWVVGWKAEGGMQDVRGERVPEVTVVNSSELFFAELTFRLFLPLTAHRFFAFEKIIRYLIPSKFFLVITGAGLKAGE
jgi:hypothetical protein